MFAFTVDKIAEEAKEAAAAANTPHQQVKRWEAPEKAVAAKNVHARRGLEK